MNLELTVDNSMKILNIFMIWMPITLLVCIIGIVSQYWDILYVGIGLVVGTMMAFAIFIRKLQKKEKEEEETIK